LKSDPIPVSQVSDNDNAQISPTLYSDYRSTLIPTP
jgi:hypothetical protein